MIVIGNGVTSARGRGWLYLGKGSVCLIHCSISCSHCCFGREAWGCTCT